MLNEILYLSDFPKHKPLDEINLIWKAIMSMDLIELYTVLNPNIEYTNSTKTGFMKWLDDKFRKHQSIKDEEFYLNLLECPKCHKGEIICEFVGVSSGINFGLYFEFEEGKVISIDRCSFYGDIDTIWDIL